MAVFRYFLGPALKERKNKIENVTDNEYQKEYQKEYQQKEKTTWNRYQKVIAWLKKHPGNTDYPKKWDTECLEIAKKYLEKHA